MKEFFDMYNCKPNVKSLQLLSLQHTEDEDDRELSCSFMHVRTDSSLVLGRPLTASEAQKLATVEAEHTDRSHGIPYIGVRKKSRDVN